MKFKWVFTAFLSVFAAVSTVNAVDFSKPTVLQAEQAQSLFKEMQAHKEIPFDFPLAGCVERAHEMSRLILLKGIIPVKAFAEPNGGAPLVVNHPLKPGKKIEWRGHVAPAVYVNVDGKAVLYVIDPSIETKAVPAEKWMSDMIPQPRYSKATLIVRSADSLISSGFRIDFSNENANLENQKELKRFKGFALDPQGEEKYMEEEEMKNGLIEPAY